MGPAGLGPNDDARVVLLEKLAAGEQRIGDLIELGDLTRQKCRGLCRWRLGNRDYSLREPAGEVRGARLNPLLMPFIP